MNTRTLWGICAVVLFAMFGVWFFSKSTSDKRKEPPKLELEVDANRDGKIESNSTTPTNVLPQESTQPQTTPASSGSYPPWRGGRAISMDDPRWNEWRRRQTSDPKWQWKMPIEFYGKVVDEKGVSIPNAAVKFSWNDISSEGTSKSETKSDDNGLFELHGVKGKRLSVTVEKEGYEVMRSMNLYGFEYASFGHDKYYEAEPNNPVLFYLHKKGEAEPLIYREQELNVEIGKPVGVNVFGETQLQFTLVSNELPRLGRWEAQVLLSNGGIIPATEEFITEAPYVGYQSALTIDQKTPRPQTWVNDRGDATQGGPFYLYTGQYYGRLDIEMTPRNDWFSVKVWINPKVGSRNIEDNPDRRISPDRIKRVGLEKAIEEVKGR